MNGNHKSLPSCVGGVSGKDDIADVWREHFDKLGSFEGNRTIT